MLRQTLRTQLSSSSTSNSASSLLFLFSAHFSVTVADLCGKSLQNCEFSINMKYNSMTSSLHEDLRFIETQLEIVFYHTRVESPRCKGTFNKEQKLLFQRLFNPTSLLSRLTILDGLSVKFFNYKILSVDSLPRLIHQRRLFSRFVHVTSCPSLHSNCLI